MKTVLSGSHSFWAEIKTLDYWWLVTKPCIVVRSEICLLLFILPAFSALLCNPARAKARLIEINERFFCKTVLNLPHKLYCLVENTSHPSDGLLISLAVFLIHPPICSFLLMCSMLFIFIACLLFDYFICWKHLEHSMFLCKGGIYTLLNKY